MTAVRQALGRALVGMIAAEFFLSAAGLGSLLITQSEQFDTVGMLAVTLVITVIGVILMAIGRRSSGISPAGGCGHERAGSGARPGPAGRWPARATGGGPGAGGAGRRRALLAPWWPGSSSWPPGSWRPPPWRRPTSPAHSASSRRSGRADRPAVRLGGGFHAARRHRGAPDRRAAGTATGLVMGRMGTLTGCCGCMWTASTRCLGRPGAAADRLVRYTPRVRLAVIVIEATLPIIFSVAEGVRSVPPATTTWPGATGRPGGGSGRGWRSRGACRTCWPGSTWRSAGRYRGGGDGIHRRAERPRLLLLFHVRSFAEDEAMVAVGVLIASPSLPAA